MDSAIKTWLKNNSNGEIISRMYLAIFDSNKIFRKIYKFLKFRILRIQFIRLLWPFLPYNLPSHSFYDGYNDKFLLFKDLLRNFKRINSSNSKRV